MKNELGITVCRENCIRGNSCPKNRCPCDNFISSYQSLESRIRELLSEKKEMYLASALCGAILKANGLKGCKEDIIAINELVAKCNRYEVFIRKVADMEEVEYDYGNVLAKIKNPFQAKARALLESEAGDD